MSNAEKEYLIYLTERELKGAIHNCVNGLSNNNTPPDQMENLVKKLKARQQMVKILSYVLENDLLDTILED